ncbi:hypothetical protein [Deinococcus alpinitundrae]|uniref:hypothetical protein n=1 Tax=Deinococcus alpinitundrae TaxID=468913 RepID=UPI00137B8F98|nr:hypothetical protein [Deinococcus alpinitundrae]
MQIVDASLNTLEWTEEGNVPEGFSTFQVSVCQLQTFLSDLNRTQVISECAMRFVGQGENPEARKAVLQTVIRAFGLQGILGLRDVHGELRRKAEWSLSESHPVAFTEEELRAY